MILSVIVPCWTGDEDKAMSMLKWIAELGKVDATCYVLCSDECSVTALINAARDAFGSAHHVRDHINRKSNWSSNDPGSRDASGPNSMFEQAAWFMHMPKPKGPWLWLEPDCRPLTRDWFTLLSREYAVCGKPVMGDYITSNSPHMSGVAIYPDDVPQRFPKMIFNTQGAFDVADAAHVIEQAHVTKRIQDCFRTEVWTEETFSKIRPEAVLFCGTKSDTLLTFLRRKLGMIEAPTVLPLVQDFYIEKMKKRTDREIMAGSAPFVAYGDASMAYEAAKNIIVGRLVKAEPWPAPVVDIYLKTWPRDHELANLCLKSIERFVTGYRQVIIEDPKMGGGSTQYPEPIVTGSLKAKLVKSEDQKPGYLWQQKQKLESYKLSDAQYFLWVDSDCCFNRPVDVSEFFVNGKSKWRYTPLNLARPDQSSTWVPVMRKFLGIEPTEEYMREHPTMVPRWLMEEMEKFCLYKHGMALGDYIMAQSTGGETDLVFSEINCAGFFARTFHRDKFEWVPDDQATPCLVQGFTWAGPERIQQDIAKFKEILGEDEPPTQELAVRPVDGLEAPLNIEISMDGIWQYLAAEAARSPGRKGRIVRQFNSVMASVKPKMPKGFGKGRKKSERKTNAIVSIVA